MSLTHVILKDDFERILRNVAKTIKNTLENVHDSAFMLRDKSFIVTRLQAATSINLQTRPERLVYNVIIDHCIKSEKFGPGAFGFTLKFIIDRILSGEEKPFPEISNVLQCSFRPTWENLKGILSNTIPDKMSREIMFEALELAGLEGRIFVERGMGTMSSIEKINGYNFNVSIPIKFAGLKKQVKVAVIDGIIESVSEIHHVLHHFSDTHETLLLVVRGLSDDVLNTLRVNVMRKTLDVYPVIVKYDFDGLNILGDIATVCLSDVVSSAKGQLISAIDYEKLQTIKSMACNENTLTIQNENVLHRTELLISQLLEKSKETELEQFKKIYDDRIRSLTPSSIRIRIVDDRSFSDFAEKIDISLRVVRSSMQHGIFSSSRMKNNDGSLDCFQYNIPIETAVSSITYAKQCFDVLKSIHAMIIA